MVINEDKWELVTTDSINQLLRVKKDIDLEGYETLVVVKHNFHVADDIMFPDPACLSFFTAFEKNHLEKLEEEGFLKLCAVDIKEGLIQFYIYCKDYEQTIEKLIEFLKTNNLYECEFEVVIEDKGARLRSLI
ncbi:hypothetical protein CRV01_00115 [Arcobacter sp. CECT 8983]|uniref:DUF695 domain-containing protein n=1 Tax=Arcobacter sp. CECT 8983 TaxID=2044508 RepID=UPI00100B7748|nr:DUF695 domain-containing protein [Arcobacter sp. CECT 8983]RXJ91532.1 hypothetical protein CRV01_00115 [Arcobacter sp. CECT 8983]